jgi:hypothetical protein
MRAYIAHAMTGRTGMALHLESELAKDLLDACDIEALDPVVIEGVEKNHAKLVNTPEEVREHWRRDKQMIRRAHVLIDLTPEMKSEGVSHEIGYARYFLWIPVIRVGKVHPSSIAYFEDDIIVPDLATAARLIHERFGSLRKRLWWRFNMYRRSWLKACWFKLREWK